MEAGQTVQRPQRPAKTDSASGQEGAGLGCWAESPWGAGARCLWVAWPGLEPLTLVVSTPRLALMEHSHSHLELSFSGQPGAWPTGWRGSIVCSGKALPGAPIPNHTHSPPLETQGS